MNNSVVSGNSCNKNDHYGIAVRGSKNIIIGNTSSGHHYACISVGGLGNIVTDNTFSGDCHAGISVGNLNSISVGNTSNGQSEGNNLREEDNIIIVGTKYDPLEVKKNFRVFLAYTLEKDILQVIKEWHA